MKEFKTVFLFFRRFFVLWLSLIIVLFLNSCSPKKAEPVAVTFKEIRFKKVMIWVQNGVVYGGFGIVNEKNQELAMSGVLSLDFFLESEVNEAGAQLKVKGELYKTSLPVKISDFQWVYYHSFLTEDDFICRFKISLSKFRVKPPNGRFIKFKISFKPDAYPSNVEMVKNLWIPEVGKNSE